VGPRASARRKEEEKTARPRKEKNECPTKKHTASDAAMACAMSCASISSSESMWSAWLSAIL
jgi:hypothetical protein